MLSTNNIEAELSYAYLHALAAKAGMNCQAANIHKDGFGVDAELSHNVKGNNDELNEAYIDVQLKATVKPLTDLGSHYSYFLSGGNQGKRFEELKDHRHHHYRILAVLQLPNNPDEWLSVSADSLIIKNAAWFVNLYNCKDQVENSGKTVYLPKQSLLTPEALIEVSQMVRTEMVKAIDNRSWPDYTKPTGV